MTLIQPGQLTLNPEDNFVITNSMQDYACIGEFCPHKDHQYDRNHEAGHVIHKAEDLTYTYARRPFTIRVGESKQVPFDIIRLYFGDPRSVPDEFLRYEDYDGAVGDIPPRQQEVMRVAGLYGLYSQNMHLLPTHPRISAVTITTVPTATSPSVEIFTPAIDPDGEVGIYGHAKVTEESNDLATILSELRAQRAHDEDRIAKLEETLKNVPINEDPEIGRDGPHRG